MKCWVLGVFVALIEAQLWCWIYKCLHAPLDFCTCKKAHLIMWIWVIASSLLFSQRMVAYIVNVNAWKLWVLKWWLMVSAGLWPKSHQVSFFSFYSESALWYLSLFSSWTETSFIYTVAGFFFPPICLHICSASRQGRHQSCRYMFFKTIKDVVAHVPLVLLLVPTICSDTLFISSFSSQEQRAAVIHVFTFRDTSLPSFLIS